MRNYERSYADTKYNKKELMSEKNIRINIIYQRNEKKIFYHDDN